MTLYVHIACDNHITETGWERTQKEIPFLTEVEDETKDCYALKKNSAKRTKALQELSKKYEEDYLALRGIFKIRFLTSELSALRAKVTDHEQLLSLSLQLSKDTKVKPERRKEIALLHQRLKNSKNFSKLLESWLHCKKLFHLIKNGDNDKIYVHWKELG